MCVYWRVIIECARCLFTGRFRRRNLVDLLPSTRTDTFNLRRQKWNKLLRRDFQMGVWISPDIPLGGSAAKGVIDLSKISVCRVTLRVIPTQWIAGLLIGQRRLNDTDYILENSLSDVVKSTSTKA